MPSIAPPSKIAATRGYGARVTFSGSTAAEREAVTAEVIAETGARLVPPYDHPDIVLGQGTLGLELQEDAARLIADAEGGRGGGRCSFAATTTSATEKKKNKGLDVILAPCGGGGMLSGVALACEGTGIRVFGCEPSFEGADDAKRGFEAGVRVEGVKTLTIADGLRTQVSLINIWVFCVVPLLFLFSPFFFPQHEIPPRGDRLLTICRFFIYTILAPEVALHSAPSSGAVIPVSKKKKQRKKTSTDFEIDVKSSETCRGPSSTSAGS